jgi:hypothetical protein
MLKRYAATLHVLLVLTPGCGGNPDDTSKNGDAACFTVTPDASATALGAIAGKATQCVRLTSYDQETASDGSSSTTTEVLIDAEGNGRPSPGWATSASLDMMYVDANVAPATFHASDRCGYGRPSVKVTLGYEAYDPSDGVYAEWSCTTCMDQSATFDLSITAVEGRPPANVGAGLTPTKNTIHGTLHAVCAPSTSPATGNKPGAGNVTIDGPF